MLGPPKALRAYPDGTTNIQTLRLLYKDGQKHYFRPKTDQLYVGRILYKIKQLPLQNHSRPIPVSFVLPNIPDLQIVP